uniref:Alpha-galactosidase NEW3 domain-containing protein n=1 Tax=Candidatus Methanogaster sp. ANME-2c ERB4 TaxID=2759911 RepID=A0A7G9YGS5_9EURY|nr:hypothetical protein CAHJBFHG_00007 [Methanosarcinales archaeon ANME-2c ERB4]QNO45783.1 hypothetical protein HJDPDKJO_00007 [Methanosarcinales archaeon ANME-2c ERB4]QNO47209.1 hypothetical protein ADAEDOLL_00015 [Methanosarcinales archaeon ANME-2c ERB4]QNO47244.1 hypothetical protein FPGOGKGP_00003 [Methanosarcinales archaeon ANME-2c ERB4]
MEGIFTKTSAVRGRGFMLALLLALVSAAAISGVATAGVDEFYVSTQEVVVEYSSETTDMPELNLTILRINPDWYNTELMPGDSCEITVAVTNPNNETVSVDPMIIEDPYSEHIFDEDWITITPSAAELEPDGGKKKFTITIAIPDDADLGYYGVMIAFTDDAKPYPEPQPYPSYINTLNLDVEVWKPPVVQILPDYIDDRVESGKWYDYAITLKNTGDEDIAIDPELADVGRYGWYNTVPAFGGDAITIDAPSSVPANGTATVGVHLEVPAGAKGRYDGGINMGIDDPSMGRWGGEGGEVDLHFEVWAQPTEPFIKAFVTETDSPITILVKSSQNKWFGACRIDDGDRGDCEPYFDLTLEGPAGTATLAPTLITYHGSVRLSGILKYAPGTVGIDEVYNEDYTSYTEEYLANGTIGNWELGILPHYAEEFEYTIGIGEAG